MEDTNVLRIFERKIVRKINGCVRAECWRLRTNKEIMDILQDSDIVKFAKSLTKMVWSY
jgi:hypothetical protein